MASLAKKWDEWRKQQGRTEQTKQVEESKDKEKDKEETENEPADENQEQKTQTEEQASDITPELEQGDTTDLKDPENGAA